MALSCMRADVTTTFNLMNEVPEDVYVLHGVLDFDESLLPQGVINEGRNPDPIPGRFEGLGLTLNGFTSTFDRPILVQSVCYGPWCGSVTAGEELIVFAKVLGEDVVVEVDPCGTTAFSDPTPDMEDTLTSCIRGEACKSSIR